jgi:glutamyl-tRNA synthetase
VLVALRERVHTLKEMAERARIWYAPIEQWDDKAVAKHLRNANSVAILQLAKTRLAAATEWSRDLVHQVVEQSAAELGLGLGKIAQPLRVAMTGTQVSPSIEDTVYLAGRAEALKRIDAALAMAQG